MFVMQSKTKQLRVLHEKLHTKSIGLCWCGLHLWLNRGQSDSDRLLLTVHRAPLVNYGKKTSILLPGWLDLACPTEDLAKPCILQPAAFLLSPVNQRGYLCLEISKVNQ